ncbi:MAG: histidine phosphatase family protein [Flavobacteriaceae bacterium]|nr:histidine phosphatase family protein [Flavobacteriaceae bacterium]
MKHLLTLILCVTFVNATPAQEATATSNKSIYYFIRHAEKDKSNKNNKNPNLLMEGVLRAAKWSLVFDHIKFDAVYSTDYTRTRDTAKPTAEKNGLDLIIYAPQETDVQTFLEITKGQTVLVVGHSNTTPMFVNSILGTEKYQNMNDSQHANLYIVTITSSGEITDTLLVVE